MFRRFSKAQFTITAILPSLQQSTASAIDELQSVEGKLLEKQAAIRAFESDYKKVHSATTCNSSMKSCH